eukprot:scaffold307074_cov17-Tisochrysis_lutea.AAC.1
MRLLPRVVLVLPMWWRWWWWCWVRRMGAVGMRVACHWVCLGCCKGEGAWGRGCMRCDSGHACGVEGGCIARREGRCFMWLCGSGRSSKRGGRRGI